MKQKHFTTGLKTVTAAAALLLSLASPEAQAAKEGFGVGIIAGEPTGLSVKKWTDDVHAFDAAFAVSLSGNNAFQFHTDYLIHNNSDLSTPEMKGNTPWYYGIGARLKVNDNDTHFGIRVPLGISYLFADSPMDFFAEVAPVLDLAPKVELGLNGAIGLRYYFH